jgi:hypothetical protein
MAASCLNSTSACNSAACFIAAQDTAITDERRDDMPKGQKISLIIIVCFLVIALCVQLIFQPLGDTSRLFGHLYPGDHITLGLRITVDGEQIDMGKAKITCDHQGIPQLLSHQSGLVSTRGGDYGMYSFAVTLPGGTIAGEDEDLTAHIDYMNANNWYIAVIGCDIALERKDAAYAGTAAVKSSYNDGTSDSFTEDVRTVGTKSFTLTFGL